MDRFIIRKRKFETDDHESKNLAQSSTSCTNIDERYRNTPSTSKISQTPTTVSVEESEIPEKEDLSGSETENNENEPIKRRKIYHQKFRDEWRTKYSWLRNKNGSYCCICERSIVGGFSHLERHSKSEFHKKRVRACAKTTDVQKLLRHEEDFKRSAELKMVMFVAEHNLPFRILEHMPKLVSNMCPDSEIAKNLKCSRTKGTALVCKHCAPEDLENICRLLQHRKYSLIIDETTDISTSKCLAVVVRVYDDFSIKDKFLTLLKVENATAEGLLSSVLCFFKENNIPINNMIGFAADNCSVMMGKKEGLQAKLKQKVPNIFIMGCICHSMNLCSSAACEKLPSTIEDLSRDVYNYLKQSSKRQSELQEFQTFLNIKPHKILKLSQTRWLSLGEVVDRLLEQWNAIELFFTRAALDDNLQAAKCIINALRNPVYKVYYTFLSFILNIVNKLNLLFQREKPLITSLLSLLKKHFRIILKCFLKHDYVEKTRIDSIDPLNVHEYLNIENMYFGAKTELLYATLSKDDLLTFKKRALDFYITLSLQIKKRIDFNDTILNAVEALHPEAVMMEPEKRQHSIVPLLKLFPNIVEEDEFEILNSEWRLITEFQDNLKNIDDPEEFWIKIKDGENSFLFKNIGNFALSILSLPHSSASTERIFSQLNLIKNKMRSRLHVTTCDALLHTKQLLGGEICCNWNPSKSLLNKHVSTTETSETENAEVVDDLATTTLFLT